MKNIWIEDQYWSYIKHQATNKDDTIQNTLSGYIEKGIIKEQEEIERYAEQEERTII